METLSIHALAFGGAGVGRLASGKVAFVQGGAPGDLLRLRIRRERRSHVEASIEEVLEPGPDRVEPVCPSAGRCGGCPWMHLSLESQRRWKRQLLASELLRAGLIDDEEQLHGPEEGQGLGYRIRTRLHLRGTHLGTMARRSREVVPLNRCPVLVPGLEQLALEVLEATASGELGRADLELYVDAQGRRGLYVDGRHARSRPAWRRLESDLGASTLLQEDSARFSLAFKPGVFVQANREMNGVLVRLALEAAGSGARFFELYAGAGNFTVHLARRFGDGISTEGDRRAVAMLRRNLERAGAHVEAVAARDTEAIALMGDRGPFDLLLADPPRAGMRAAVEELGREPPERIVMVSCNPMTAIRDMKRLVEKWRYRLDRIHCLDMFPQTDHLELVALLRR